jgi:hypothetical protein
LEFDDPAGVAAVDVMRLSLKRTFESRSGERQN